MPPTGVYKHEDFRKSCRCWGTQNVDGSSQYLSIIQLSGPLSMSLTWCDKSGVKCQGAPDDFLEGVGCQMSAIRCRNAQTTCSSPDGSTGER